MRWQSTALLRHFVWAGYFKLKWSHPKARLRAHSPAAGRTSSPSPVRETAPNILKSCCSAVAQLGGGGVRCGSARLKLRLFPLSWPDDDYHLHHGNSFLCLRGASLTRQKCDAHRVMAQRSGIRASADHISLRARARDGVRVRNVACGGCASPLHS